METRDTFDVGGSVISARVDGTVETVSVDDNKFLKAGQTLVVLDRPDFNVAAGQARAQVLQRPASADQAQANQTHTQQDYDGFTKLGKEQVVVDAKLRACSQ